MGLLRWSEEQRARDKRRFPDRSAMRWTCVLRTCEGEGCIDRGRAGHTEIPWRRTARPEPRWSARVAIRPQLRRHGQIGASGVAGAEPRASSRFC